VKPLIDDETLKPPYHDWQRVRSDAAAVIARDAMFAGLSGRRLRQLIERAVVVASHLAGDPGNASVVSPFHLTAAIFRLHDEESQLTASARAVRAILDRAEQANV